MTQSVNEVSSRKKRTLYCIHNVRLPTEKAHGVQISKMGEAFADEGMEVVLLVPRRTNPLKEDFFSYYHVRRNVTLRFVSCSDLLTPLSTLFPRLGFYLQALSFLSGLCRVSVPSDVVILTRNPEIAWWYGRKGYRVFFDAHAFPMQRAALWLHCLKRVVGVVANSRGTAEAFLQATQKPVLAVPNGVDLDQFKTVSEEVGEDVPSGPVVMYLGHLYGWKGVDTVVAAAQLARDQDLSFVLIGGTDADVARYRRLTEGMSNIFFLGHKTRSEIPSLMRRADVLLLPNIPSTQESVAYTSPIKMFEYMASGKPIVASDLPSLREVLNEQNAILVEAGNPKALLAGIKTARTSIGAECARRAYEDVKEYTWQKRARKILQFMQTYVWNYR